MTKAGRRVSGPCFGERGVLTKRGGKVKCHICGRFVMFLGQHVVQIHHITPHDYIRDYSLKAALARDRIGAL